VPLRKIGVKSICRFITRNSKKLWFRYGKMYLLELPLDSGSASLNHYGYQVEIISTMDGLNTLTKRRESWFGEVAAKRFSQGDLCFALKKNGEIISCLFATLKPVVVPIRPYLEYNLPLDKETVCLIDAFTVPEFRGAHAYSAVFNAFYNYFKGKKFKRIFVFIKPDNIISLKVHQKLGFHRIIMDIKSIRVFGMNKHFIKWTNKAAEEIL